MASTWGVLLAKQGTTTNRAQTLAMRGKTQENDAAQAANHQQVVTTNGAIEMSLQSDDVEVAQATKNQSAKKDQIDHSDSSTIPTAVAINQQVVIVSLRDDQKAIEDNSTPVVKDFPGDSIPVSIVRRLFSNSDALFMIYNTLNTIIAMSETAGAFTSTGYGQTVSFTDATQAASNDDDYITTWGCEFGDISLVTVTCPYEDSPIYKAVLSIWIIYFAILLVSKVAYSFPYKTNDFRYYISLDKFNSTRLNKFLIYIGIALTIVSGLLALSFGLMHENTSSASSAVLFIIVNAMSLHSLTSCGFKVLNKDLGMKDFEPIRIKNPINSMATMYGLLISSVQLYEGCKLNMLKALYHNDNHYLSEVGNPAQLKRVISTLYELESDQLEQPEPSTVCSTKPAVTMGI